MARRKPSEISGQENLFLGGDANDYSDSTFRTWQEVESNPLLRSAHIRGSIAAPAVDVSTRAHYLRSAAVNQGKANQRVDGLGDGVHIEPHATEIWGRLKEKTPYVVEHAAENAVGYANQARRDFWVATGFAAVIASGMINRDEAQALSRVWFRNFNTKSKGGKTGDKAKKAKQEFVGGFGKQITAQKKLKKRLGSQGKTRVA